MERPRKSTSNQPFSKYLGKLFMNHKRDNLHSANGDAFSYFMVLGRNSGDGPPWFCASLLTQSCHSIVLSHEYCFCHFVRGTTVHIHIIPLQWRVMMSVRQAVRACTEWLPVYSALMGPRGCSVPSSELPTREHWSSSIEEGHQDTQVSIWWTNRVWEHWYFSVWKGQGERKTWLLFLTLEREVIEKMETTLAQRCMVKGHDTVGTSCSKTKI